LKADIRMNTQQSINWQWQLPHISNTNWYVKCKHHWYM
jgi:hypothetical protein